jgi:hypothetical protein
MLNKKQIEIANLILKYLDSVGGKSNRDDYPSMFEKNGIENWDWHPLIQILIEDLELVKYWGDAEYWIMLTPQGNKAASNGIEKYFEDLEQDQQLDRNFKRANIESVEKANKNSKNAIKIAIIIPVLIAVIQIYFNYRISSVKDGDNNSRIRSEINHSQFPLSRTDSTLVEKIKDSLKHDTVFINDLKNMINK